MSSYHMSILFPLLLLTMGCILVTIYYQKGVNEGKQFRKSEIKVNANITELKPNVRECSEGIYCDYCRSSKGLPKCDNVSYPQYCKGTTIGCCQPDDDDFIGASNKTKINDTTGNVDCFRSYPKCWAVVGYCYTPQILVKFRYDNETINTQITKKCKMNDYDCMNNFLDPYHVNETISIYFYKNNPNNVFLTHQKYKMPTNYKVAMNFGITFIVIGVMIYMCCASYYCMNKKKYSYDYL